jgi:peptidoglycan/LPS O-acetylase OafA/YrhL
VLATYPIRFISYPVFFEMGVWAQEKAWNEKITIVAGICTPGAYFLLVLLFSQILPKLSANELVKYIFYYFAGTASMFTLSVALKSNRILRWLGAISYPIFLLHEPLIGGYMDLLLNRLNINHEVIWFFAWIVFVLLVSVILMQLLVKLRLDRLLWKFKI